MSAFTEFLAATEMGVDLDAVVPCQSNVTPCDQEAAWVGYAPCCRTSRNLCDEHRQRVIDRRTDAVRIHGHDRIRCSWCGIKPMPDVTWRPL